MRNQIRKIRRSRVKLTSFGQRGGEGPNTGKSGTWYGVQMPDGTYKTKMSFKVKADDAVAGIYQSQVGMWHIAGIWPKGEEVGSGQTAVAAKRVGS